MKIWCAYFFASHSNLLIGGDNMYKRFKVGSFGNFVIFKEIILELLDTKDAE